jgi:hypothetical protein
MTKPETMVMERAFSEFPTLSLIRYSPLENRHSPLRIDSISRIWLHRGREMARSLYVARSGMRLHYDCQPA